MLWVRINISVLFARSYLPMLGVKRSKTFNCIYLFYFLCIFIKAASNNLNCSTYVNIIPYLRGCNSYFLFFFSFFLFFRPKCTTGFALGKKMRRDFSILDKILSGIFEISIIFFFTLKIEKSHFVKTLELFCVNSN